ncbi:Group II intron-encoded protein LtrA [Planctomycetes bacterium Pan216]|uniref:Group II intron-encoded protein LtrA n=1 Tax=Kolteria novifilia TaxID=2527975 RepID=A0A518BBG8_9BACT|nr:Group II intron-encoded protein LtrA [Planctomycetes bacterium Pan216]
MKPRVALRAPWVPIGWKCEPHKAALSRCSRTRSCRSVISAEAKRFLRGGSKDVARRSVRSVQAETAELRDGRGSAAENVRSRSALFHEDSYGFRPGRSAHDAIKRVKELHRQKHRFVLDADIKGFFDAIPHSVVMKGLANVVADGNILGTVERMLKAGVMEEGILHPTTVGTPQGGVLSPLLANIALNFLDWQLDELGLRHVRYADDFVVLCKSKRQVQEARQLVEEIIQGLGLTLSPEKTVITNFQEGFDFLGFHIKSQTMTMRAKSVEKFKDRVRILTKRCHNFDATVVEKLNALVRGVARYFAVEEATCVNQFRKLDQWLRMRLRCMRSKRKSDRDNCRMPIRHFRRRGLIFLSDIYPLRC